MLMSTSAFASPPATANSIQLGLGFRYGFELEEGDFNPWKTGLGVSGGFTLANAIYLGGNFDYFFGDKQDFPGGGDQRANVWQIVAEGGYDLGIGPNFVVRPKAGIGAATLMGEVCLKGFPCVSNSDTHLAIAPGTTFIVMTSRFSLTLDFRYNMTLTDDHTLKALIFSAGVGL
jgi:hypothetical protein